MAMVVRVIVVCRACSWMLLTLLGPSFAGLGGLKMADASTSFKPLNRHLASGMDSIAGVMVPMDRDGEDHFGLLVLNCVTEAGLKKYRQITQTRPISAMSTKRSQPRIPREELQLMGTLKEIQHGRKRGR